MVHRTPPPNLNCLITAFAERVPSIAHAALLSSGGLPLACSDGLSAERVDQLAAVASGLPSLVHAAARRAGSSPRKPAGGQARGVVPPAATDRIAPR
jgi:predicted regulator of Ras-like GTPase activity (Roadblock/LC7/MglB family)